eukprot:7410456-Pyramimonas_sp.AAC.1
MSSMRQSATSFRQSVGLEDPVGEQSLISEIDQATTLSYGQRFHGFVISLGLGIVCSGLVSSSLQQVVFVWRALFLSGVNWNSTLVGHVYFGHI